MVKLLITSLVKESTLSKSIMESLKIIFYILGTFFANDASQIAAEKTTVIIAPKTKTITIKQKNIFSIITSTEDSLKIMHELKEMKAPNYWRPELSAFSQKKIAFYTSRKGHLNAKMTLKYRDKNDLYLFGLTENKNGNLSLINIPSENIRSKKGKLIGNYWDFKANKCIKFTMEPHKNIPEKYKVHKKSLAPYWEQIKE